MKSPFSPHERVWMVAAVTGIVSAWPVAHFAKTIPWLVGVTIVVGTLIATAWELAATCSVKKPGPRKSDTHLAPG